MQQLDAEFGQAWLDGKNSIRDTRVQPPHFLPLWFVMYFMDVRRLAKVNDAWVRAAYFLYSDDNKADDEERDWRSKAIDIFTSISGWHGQIPGPDESFMFDHLAEVLGKEWLPECVVDGLVADVRRRMNTAEPAGTASMVADLAFTGYITDWAADNLVSRAEAGLERYADLLRSSYALKHLVFPLYSPPYHWTAGAIDVDNKAVHFGDSLGRAPPHAFISALKKWFETVLDWPLVQITRDLRCGKQQDSFNCGVIAVNTIAHLVLGDELWIQRKALAHRLRAFCILGNRILHVQNGPAYTGPVWEQNPPLESVQAAAVDSVSTDIDMANMDTPGSHPTPVQVTDDNIATLISATSSKPSTKRTRPSNDSEVPAPKRAKGTAGKVAKPSTAQSQSSPPALTASSLIPAIPEHVQLRIIEVLANGGQSGSARHDRVVSVLINAGLYRGSETKLAVLRKECMYDGCDPDPGLDVRNPKQVVCSRCKQAVQLQSVYQAKRFRDHWFNTKKPCKPPPPANQSIGAYFGKASKPATKPPCPKITKLCGGLTGHIHPRIDYYIEHCPATGAGAHSINFYVAQLYEKDGISSITDHRITLEQRKAAYQRQVLDRQWRIETSPHSSAVVSTSCLGKFTVRSKAALSDPKVVCESCWAVFLLKEFRVAINKDQEKTYAQMKCTPKIHSNPIQARLMGKYKGLEEIINEGGEDGFLMCFVRGVGQGLYKDKQVFMGLVETMQLATDRQIRNKGMQNFKYPIHYRELGTVVGMCSREAQRIFSQHFRMETERSMKHQIAQRPRFPLGITTYNFNALAKYCSNYGYPQDHPLCVSVDDTKLFATMQPLHDGPKKTWYLMGIPGERQLQVVSPEELDKLMDQKHHPATKLRLWAVQIPFPGIPPLAFAILPIASTTKAPELACHQLQLLNGLVERKHRFISNVADRASVERDVQLRVADSSTTAYYKIKPPTHLSMEEPIVVALHTYRGNTFINTQDASHARKTGRNNICSGARLLTLGDYVVHYHQIYDLAVNTEDSPLYEKDIVGYDKQDDNAANRVFSSAVLRKLIEKPAENMGLLVLLYVVGEMVDAYERRTMTQLERAGAAIQAKVFFRTWKLLNRKMGYAPSRYYISHAADKIYDMLIDGLLGLQLIHRDHLPSSDIPLLPWKHASMGNECIFAALRGIFPDMSLVQVIHALPHIRATMTEARQALFAKSNFKATRNGYSLCELEDDKSINYAQLAQQPTDAEYTVLFAEKIEANHTLWALLNVDVWNLSAPLPVVPL